MSTVTSTSTEVHQVTGPAAEAAAWLAGTGPQERAALLRALADALDGDVEALVALAESETHLGTTRLTGEVARTSGQLRLFADVVLEGSYLEATLDRADPGATPPRPALRRYLEPLGVVGVFSASNFPFAFSVLGGDTASALAAGCPVVVKAHSGHPRLSERVAELAATALRSVGAPEGVLGLVSGREAGLALVVDPLVRAVGFTGSTDGGRALFDLATGRPDPIPFYGELGSINPVVVTARAVHARGRQLAEGLVASFTLGVGQFCTKPGVVLVPDGAGLEQLVAEEVGTGPAPMLSDRIADGFHDGVQELVGSDEVDVVAGTPGEGAGTGSASPVVVVTTVEALLADPDLVLAERFGPACVLVRYSSQEELLAALHVMPGSLTATLHAEPQDEPDVSDVLAALQALAGRVVWNGWPTGVAVTWSQHHGGPWPATTAPLHTSVGATSIRRWLRPVTFQDLPDALLPPALQDTNPLAVPRREDGVLRLP